MPKKEIVSKSLADTRKIAGDFLEEILKRNNKQTRAIVVALYGNLGAGKTSFTQQAGKILGVSGRKINSPTFVIMKRYVLEGKKGLKNLFHLDAYRLKSGKELIRLGWEEIISDPAHIVFIEWPENVSKAIPRRHHKIRISHTQEGHRRFKML